MAYNEQEYCRSAVRRAIRSGELVVPLKCSECGKELGTGADGRRLIQAHHYLGYSRPLDVQWLCAKCHRAVTPLPTRTIGDRPTTRGEKNWNARLTDEQVLEILSLVDQGLPKKHIAEKFGVSHFYIYQLKDKRWRKSATALKDASE